MRFISIMFITYLMPDPTMCMEPQEMNLTHLPSDILGHIVSVGGLSSAQEILYKLSRLNKPLFQLLTKNKQNIIGNFAQHNNLPTCPAPLFINTREAKKLFAKKIRKRPSSFYQQPKFFKQAISHLTDNPIIKQVIQDYITKHFDSKKMITPLCYEKSIVYKNGFLFLTEDQKKLYFVIDKKKRKMPFKEIVLKSDEWTLSFNGEINFFKPVNEDLFIIEYDWQSQSNTLMKVNVDGVLSDKQFKYSSYIKLLNKVQWKNGHTPESSRSLEPIDIIPQAGTKNIFLIHKSITNRTLKPEPPHYSKLVYKYHYHLYLLDENMNELNQFKFLATKAFPHSCD